MGGGSLNWFRNTVSSDFSVNSYRKVTKREPMPLNRCQFEVIEGNNGNQGELARTSLKQP